MDNKQMLGNGYLDPYVDSDSDGDSYKEEAEDEEENGDTAQSAKPLLTIGQWALPTHPEDFKTFIDHG
jgi:hypothetical protein